MRYQGGKARHADAIAEQIEALRGGRDTYLEPFVGSAAVASKVVPAFREVILGDALEDVALLWAAVVDGWRPPATVTETEYRALREAPPSALRGFVGVGCSYGGKWFGGYAREGGRDFAAEAARSVSRRAAGLDSAAVVHADYRAFEFLAGPHAVIYCDPPYAGTTGYAGVGPFDHDEFWRTVTRWSARGALVLVSEYAAPPRWRPAWTAARRTQIGQSRHAVTECLYVHQSHIEQEAA